MRSREISCDQDSTDHVKYIFRELKHTDYASISIKYYSVGCYSWQSSIGLEKDLVPNRRRCIIWTNHEPVFRRNYTVIPLSHTCIFDIYTVCSCNPWRIYIKASQGGQHWIEVTDTWVLTLYLHCQFYKSLVIIMNQFACITDLLSPPVNGFRHYWYWPEPKPMWP